MPHPFLLELIENIRKAAQEQRLSAAPKVRESAAEIMDGELPIGVTSKNLAAGPTFSEIFLFGEDRDDTDV